jgi:DNA-binding transcriptional LysR family regulator
MQNYRLKVFRTVAKSLSFTKASRELFITQPAITKNIQLLEKEIGLRLFNRSGNKIYLTEEGTVLLNYTNKLSNLEMELENELNFFRKLPTGKLRLGCSTTIAQYVIPPVLSVFKKKFSEVKLSLISGNTEQIANILLKGEIDLGIVEGKIKNKDIHYNKFVSDELVPTIGLKSDLYNRNEISLKELESIPLILRERGSGTLEVIELAFKSKRINLSKLNVLMYLGSTEAIKHYLECDSCLSFISTRAINAELKTGVLKTLRIKNFRIIRNFEFITLQGLHPSKLVSKFIETAKKFYS